MKMIFAVAGLLISFSLNAHAGSHGLNPLGSLIWLGEIEDAQRTVWEAKGLRVVAVPCPEADCMTQILVELAAETPTHLIAQAKHTGLVRDLYARAIDKDDLRGVVLLRTQRDNPIPVETHANAPDLLVLVETTDPKDVVFNAHQLASAYLNDGIKSSLIFTNKDMLSETSLHPVAVDIILHFMGQKVEEPTFNRLMDAYAVWQSPPFDNQAFLDRTDLLTTHPMDGALMQSLDVHYKFEPHLLNQWRFETYTAFDLVAYRDEVAPEARYVTLRNRRGQLYYLDLEWYAAFDPVIVVGIDDEINMYRFFWFYRTKAMYSWYPSVPTISTRLLGPVLHFRKDIPDDLVIPLLLISALTFDGIEFSRTDPLAPIATYPPDVRLVITKNNKCIYCHPIAGIGGNAYHVDALTTQPQGGIALPLANYPDAVVESFLFDQVNSANAIGMTPNHLNERLIDPFHNWLRGQSQ